MHNDTILFWIDVETTGLDPLKNSVISLYGIAESIKKGHIQTIDLNAKPIEPESEIDLAALEINGFSLKRIQQFPHPREAVDSLIQMLKPFTINNIKVMIAGYNVHFDYSFLKKMFERE